MVGKPRGFRARSQRAEPQLVLWKQRGGKRRGAGRPPKGRRAGSPHEARPFLHARYPVHVVLRAVGAVGNLRRRCVYQAVREATLTTARREDFRVVHLSIQRTHIHLLVEAENKEALARGMQGFQISAAKHLNAAISKGKPGPRRRGAVFPDRYHAEIITSPRQARHALSYVMNNWRKHEEDRRAPMSAWTVDWFSTAAMFPGWTEYGEEAFLWRGPPTYDPLVVYQPKTWLLREGWKKAGAISCHVCLRRCGDRSLDGPSPYACTVVRLPIEVVGPDQEDLGVLRIAASRSEIREGVPIEGEPVELDWQAPDTFDTRTSWVRAALAEAVKRLERR